MESSKEAGRNSSTENLNLVTFNIKTEPKSISNSCENLASFSAGIQLNSTRIKRSHSYQANLNQRTNSIVWKFCEMYAPKLKDKQLDTSIFRTLLGTILNKSTKYGKLLSKNEFRNYLEKLKKISLITKEILASSKFLMSNGKWRELRLSDLNGTVTPMNRKQCKEILKELIKKLYQVQLLYPQHGRGIKNGQCFVYAFVAVNGILPQ